eukprot:6186520-Pleurochrysis_carterae.AAC.9
MHAWVRACLSGVGDIRQDDAIRTALEPAGDVERLGARDAAVFVGDHGTALNVGEGRLALGLGSGLGMRLGWSVLFRERGEEGVLFRELAASGCVCARSHVLMSVRSSTCVCLSLGVCVHKRVQVVVGSGAVVRACACFCLRSRSRVSACVFARLCA